MPKFRVISKFALKAYSIYPSTIAHYSISRTQSAFIKGCHIHEGMVSLQVIVHETKSKKLTSSVMVAVFARVNRFPSPLLLYG
jgi:hypothetical protein